MEKILIYLIQINLLISMVYLGYVLLLRGLTYYHLNRVYFLTGMLFAFSYPFLDIRNLFAKHVEPIEEWMDFIPAYLPQAEPDHLYSVNNLFLLLIGIGVVLFFIRMLLQLGSVARVYLRSDASKWYHFPYRDVRFPIVPFSFLKTIYLHRPQHQEQELEHIFKHELYHTRGLHSIDILLVNLVQVLCWYNPLIYLLRRAVQQNLEFLTDQQVLELGIDRQSYQYNLLHVNRGGVATPITNKFNFKMLKQRIMMMNKKRSSRLQLSKYAMVIPVLVFSAAAFTVNSVEANIQEVVEKGKAQVIDTQRRSTNKHSKANDVESVNGDLHRVDTIITGKRERSADSLGGGDLNNGIRNARQLSDALFILDGKEISKEEYKKIDPNTIGAMDILKKESGRALYGKKGVNGVVMITTKEAEAKKQSKTLEGAAAGIKITTDFSPEEQREMAGQREKSLVVIDGKIKNQADLNALDPNKIKAMRIWKDEEAVARYGDKAKDGAIEITTKSAEQEDVTPKNNQVSANKITSNLTRRLAESRTNASLPVTQNIGRKSSDTSVRVDKNSNLSAVRIGPSKNPPLYVVDGVIADINEVNPDNIAIIHVVKDDKASEKYGESAKRGVIEVMTKAQAKKLAMKKR